MNADKVERLVFIAWIHHDTSVGGIPDDQLAVVLCEMGGFWVIESSLAGDEEPECTLA
jgi:hypothetical protein